MKIHHEIEKDLHVKINVLSKTPIRQTQNTFFEKSL